ncbi:hypothetical protein GCK32_009742 [Trichostrongylus colubriformis]|uniref:Myosin tail domain-containing protein n=1 Tax=Trichostrongylus colubriformis TaxID=6319 RepID=A0AAN8FWW4_TRICO
MESRIKEAEAARDKAERAKVKAQQEAEDACREIMEITAALREVESKQRKFDQMFAEEKTSTVKAMADRDLAQQQARGNASFERSKRVEGPPISGYESQGYESL